MRSPLLISLCLVHASTAFADIQFNRDVRPILSDKCFACHGFDASKRKADLRLDISEGAYADNDGTRAVVPGSLAESALWQRVLSTDADEVMPPPDFHKPITPKERAILKAWIEQGARYQKHWAFEPPRKVQWSGLAPALLKMKSGALANPIDGFILARLAQEGLAFRPEADRETLIRRAAFTLTGLTPTLAQVDTFLADTSPDAYERMVDRFLNSRHYGEEMARHWLDVARYGDTHGLHLDNERSIWPYRDWVVQAFNDNLPFDQFSLWQLAGDLLPAPTTAQLVATGFNRCNVTTSEGGAIAEEFLYRYAVDRTSTTIQTWLGLTGGCAVCHDHKYDPLTMKEFYQLYAFFYSAADPGMDKNIIDTEPYLRLPKPGQQEASDAARKRQSAALQQLDALAEKLVYQDPAVAATKPEPALTKDMLFDDFWPPGSTQRNTSRNASDWVADPEFKAPSGHRVLRQKNAFYHEDKVETPLTPATVPENATVEIWVRPDPLHPPSVIGIHFESSGGNRHVWWGDEGAGCGKLETLDAKEKQGPMPKPGQWSRLSLSAASVGLKPGQHITGFTLQESGGIVYWDALSLSGTSQPAGDARASFSVWWKQMGKKSLPDVPAELQGVLGKGNEHARASPLAKPGAPTPEPVVRPEQVARLQRFYLSRIARPFSEEIHKQRSAWAAARAESEAVDAAIVGTFIFRDLDQPREAFVMLRGQYDKPGEKVVPDTPAFLPPLKKAATATRSSRLDLARWLLSPEQPLTSRVTVNRFWQQVFGVGLVRTSDDFGSQGEMPSHPELLDWLAIRFMESGWDVKALMKLMLMSQTFRQDSRHVGGVFAHAMESDPANRLLWHGPRIRLDAEQIRDNALAVSGLINLTMGGPGARTYQPQNIWEPVGYGDSNTRYYIQDHGAALHRRSLYCFLKRTAPPPFMSNFDAPNREQFCTRRERSNTPLQALQLLNDVQHFEAARALAERTLAEGDSGDSARLRYIFRTVLARQPDATEVAALRSALDQQRSLYLADPVAAQKIVSTGESKPKKTISASETAAWTLIANLLLNLDETLNRN